RAKFLRAVLRYDPSSLVHGIFMANVGDGRMRLARAASSFIEAKGVGVAQSGGVKNDRVNASGDTKEGFGNVPFARTEYTAESINAYFNLDLRQLRGYGLPTAATRLLTALALYKFARLSGEGMRLRSACDLVTERVTVTAPAGFALPSLGEIEAELSSAVTRCKIEGLFADPPVTRLSFAQTEASAKGSKKATKKDKGEAAT
ncbi:MAG: type I-U CRISPR-associated protein Cas7, partial [Verrucomicrobia bacterium]|nr:type I-U CRISPR-associated protein Cas7 [Verrucomicrobiota bacterium]